jgi:misacylated tRNA(Ala) deacylase
MRHTKFMDRIPSFINELRVVEIDGIDLCPCAGTHVASTSDIDPIVITNVKSNGAGKFRITYQFENENI